MTIKKMTPVLFVENAEPCIRFWVERFGFEKTAEVPDGDTIGFAILTKDGAELMYQTYASAAKDVSGFPAEARKGRTFLFIEVNDLDAFKTAAAGAQIAIPERTTFYGSREIGIQDPEGHFITFAQF